MTKLNCWEYMACGRGPASQTDGEPLCPAATEERLHGVHEGDNAGRACWVVPGTLCDGTRRDFTCKSRCISCDFYASVLDEHLHDLVFTPRLLAMLSYEPVMPCGRSALEDTCEHGSASDEAPASMEAYEG